MTYKEAIEQIESLIRNSASFHHENGDIWEQDIKALNIAKKALECLSSIQMWLESEVEE